MERRRGGGPARRFLKARSAVAALCLSVSLSVCLSVPGPAVAHVCQPDPTLPAGGALLVPSAGGLAVVGLDDRSIRAVPLLPAGGVVSHVARSPDGSRLAVARFTRPPGDPVGGSDVQVIGPEGGAPLLTIARERPGEVLGAPAWLPDGGLIFEQGTVAGAAGGVRLERVNADGSGRRPVAEQAAMPSVSPDGAFLAFVRSAGGDRLIVRPLDAGPERPLVDDPSFLALAFPRFSPDGQWIAFSAVTDGVPPLPTSGLGGLSSLLPGARTALAHGLPWDVWLIRPDGSGLRRLTYFYDDDAATAWSADGRWLAIFAVESIKLVPLEGQGYACVLDSGGYGGFEWISTS